MAENAFNAVERISEFCDLPQEAPEEIPETKPDGWPDKGEVCVLSSFCLVSDDEGHYIVSGLHHITGRYENMYLGSLSQLLSKLCSTLASNELRW